MPIENLEAELTYRVQCWIKRSMSCKKDFTKSVLTKLKEWEREEVKKEKVKWETALKEDIASSENIDVNQGQTFQFKVAEEEKHKVLNIIKKDCINSKKEELREIERSHALITKDLYWKYNSYIKENNYSGNITWIKWLNKYQKDCFKRIEEFHINEKNRIKRNNESLNTKHLMKVFSDIKDKLNQILDMKGFSNMSIMEGFVSELKKCLMALSQTNSIDNKMVDKDRDVDYEHEEKDGTRQEGGSHHEALKNIMVSHVYYVHDTLHDCNR